MIFCLERAHVCLGAWEGGPVVPGPPPLGPWGASRELPGGGPGPKLQGSIPVNSGHFPLSTLRIRIKTYVDFDVDF